MALKYCRTIVVEGGAVKAEDAVDGQAHPALVRGVLMIDPDKVKSFKDLGPALEELANAMTDAAKNKKFVAEDGTTEVVFKGDAAGSKGEFTPQYVVDCIERANRIHHNDQLREANAHLVKTDAKTSAPKPKRGLADLKPGAVA